MPELVELLCLIVFLKTVVHEVVVLSAICFNFMLRAMLTL